MSADQRARWWAWSATVSPDEALRKMLADLIPKGLYPQIPADALGALAAQLRWATMVVDAEQVPVEFFAHNGEQYAFASAKGGNVAGLEYALCEDYYAEAQQGDASAYLRLSACLWREKIWHKGTALRRGDWRVPLYSREEVEARAAALESAPAWVHVQAVTWFIALKGLIHKMYRSWIFDADDPDEDGEAEEPEAAPSRGPNFGWWGMFLDVAESGVFGPLPEVHQASLHDVCIFLVKKRAAELEAQRNVPRRTDPQNHD